MEIFPNRHVLKSNYDFISIKLKLLYFVFSGKIKFYKLILYL